MPSKSMFSTSSDVLTTSSGDDFVDVINSVPFIISSANSYISNTLANNKLNRSDSNFVEVGNLHQISQNLVDGNYSKLVENDENKNLIVTTYKIPYKDELKEKIATIKTYYDPTTKILFYEIPREFTYNSKDQASISITKLPDLSFVGKLLIPGSFLSSTRNRELPYKIKSNDDNNTVNTSKLTVEANIPVSFPCVECLNQCGNNGCCDPSGLNGCECCSECCN